VGTAWHSTGAAWKGAGLKGASDPLDLIGSPHAFDHTWSSPVTGTYGKGGTFCFSAHAVYGDRLLPCRRSALEPDFASGLPRVGDDILLHGSDSVYEVLVVGRDEVPSLCVLPRLRLAAAAASPVSGARRLGDGKWEIRLGSGKDGCTAAWASADTRYMILADVAIGQCKAYGPAEPSLSKDGAPPREPEGCAIRSPSRPPTTPACPTCVSSRRKVPLGERHREEFDQAQQGQQRDARGRPRRHPADDLPPQAEGVAGRVRGAVGGRR